MRWVPEAKVRAVIAHHILGAAPISDELGAVRLHPHQREGVARARHLLATRRGALIADDVGLGKTFLALAVAREYRSPVVVAPAALRQPWSDATNKAAVAVRFVSIESLSRGAWPGGGHDLVIVDEAHNLRNSGTARFAAAATLCATAPVLLLSATPVQNRTADLRTVMSLFLGEQAHALSIDELSTMIVRRVTADVAGPAMLGLPALDAPRWLTWGDDVNCLDSILALPPPVTALDDGDAGALLAWSLVRQWASSRAALIAALKRRLARAMAMESLLADGRFPSRAELAAWCCADGAQQMAFAFLAPEVRPDTAALLDDVQRHADGVRALLASLTCSTDPDARRANALAALADQSRGRRIVAFSEYSATVESLYRLLAPTRRAAMLTHAGGKVVGGRLTRRDVLARFTPGARVPERERIDLLLTTDVLSEGVNLHDASVVVHIDLPWNPARMTQRVGRVRRIGSPASSVSVHAMSPPAPAERMLEMQSRLRNKLALAEESIGISEGVLPGPLIGADAAAAHRQGLATLLENWRGGSPEDSGVAGAVRATIDGALACVRIDGQSRLVAWNDRVLVDSADIQRVAASVIGGNVEVSAPEQARAEERIRSWLRARATTDVIDLPARRAARSRRRVLQRLDYIGRNAPRHTRATLTPMLRVARSVATAALSAGAEDVLDELAAAQMSDAAWLQAVAQFASINVCAESQAEPELIALLLLRRAGLVTF